MLTLSLILSIGGLVAALYAIYRATRIGFMRLPPEEALPDGIYRVHQVGPGQYEIEPVDGE